MNQFDVVVIGGGQSGLAVGYYLRRTNLSFLILDKEERPGGSWQHHWESLRLFSPAQWSSLPGIIMKGGADYYPTRNETIEYIEGYGQKYHLPVKRPIEVYHATREADGYSIETSDGAYHAKALVSATGSFNNPFIPEIPGRKDFRKVIIHSSQYLSSDQFRNMRVAIIGDGNSGAQILAEVSLVADTLWVTLKEPKFLPDNMDGRYLFDAASQIYEARLRGTSYQPPSLGDIVMVASVKEARHRGVLKSVPPFQKFSADDLVWADGHTEKVDAVIFCTGFKPSLKHLSSLNVVNKEGRVPTEETKAANISGLWLVGYGNWTGYASATLIGVGRSAKRTVDEIVNYLT
ncbi:MAG TPA: ArsO family NAD(P)H-dependent flavin-containing monooxygenase [Cyclobacteriaceae bacterium]|nr:ArsO family NAD(P)H-dependent flavin-containing monooxygenase [Cyclobacteriaceae bacterium]